MENLKENCTPVREEEEISLLDIWRVIWKRRKMIAWIVAIITFGTLFASLFMTNIYQAKAMITPVAQKDSGGGGGLTAILAQQIGGLPGISLPGSSSASEIVNLLKSNVLREKIITKYNLLPALFIDQWDSDRKTWRVKSWYLNPLRWVSDISELVIPAPTTFNQKKDPNIPAVWDGLRKLDKIVSIQFNLKENSITIMANTRDPEFSAKLVDYYLVTLTDYMSAEARRVALTNRKYLEGQLGDASDPLIKQKIYNMIAQQIETSMMAEVKENFAFKVLDPPKVPDKKISPKRAVMVILAFIVSIMLAVFWAFGAEYVDKLRKQANSEKRE
jgi:uncharacterized protein involved in exopolysaccharide biosynthesis